MAPGNPTGSPPVAILILLERRHLAGKWNISIDPQFEKPAT
jgi:hypothetical protein